MSNSKLIDKKIVDRLIFDFDFKLEFPIIRFWLESDRQKFKSRIQNPN